MAKHSAGKHTQTRASVKRQQQLDDAEKSKGKPSKKKESKHAAPKGKKGSGVAVDSKSDSAATQPEKTSKEAESSTVTPLIAMSDGEVMTQERAKKTRNWKKIGKRVGIITGSVVGVLAIIYVAGVIGFSSYYYPNTKIGDIDISFKTPEAVRADFDSKVGDYSFTAKGHGLNMTVSAEDAGIEIDSVGMTNALIAKQDPWKWPIEFLEYHDGTRTLTDSMSSTALKDIVKAAVDKVNVDGKEPVDATIAYDKKLGSFEIVPEQQGTLLDYESVLEDIVMCAMSLNPNVVIMEDNLKQPAVFADDKSIANLKKQANDLIRANVQLKVGETVAADVNGETISEWVTITPDHQAVLNPDAMNAFINETAQAFNTVGSTRTYTRADGKVITVSGGDYGWLVDADTLSQQLTDAITNGTVGAIEVPVQQSGTGFSSLGNRDWGTRYVDVDLSEQHARFYGDDGAIIWEADIVSGERYSRDTPQGVWDVNNMGQNVTLVGRENGKVTYRTPVAYWMAFEGNSIGFHDATWQSAFGGSRYMQGFGSHGCINLAKDKAAELYGILEVGDVVVVHE